MRTKLQLLGVIGVILCNLSASGGCWLDTYWPLNDGDRWSFTRNVTVGTAEFGGGEFQVWQESGYDSVYEVHLKTVNGVYLDCADAGWVRVCFDPGVLLFDDALLQNGGSRTTRTTATQSGVDYPATFTVSVSKAGTVRVPAGTFLNCRNVTVKETAYPPGQGAVSATVMTAVLAPGVGLIKKRVGIDDRLVWVELTGGTVDGVSAGEWANRSGNLPPEIKGQPRDTTAIINGVATLSVSTTGQGLEFQWFKDGIALSDGGRISGSQTAALRIEPVLPSDAGDYEVEVSNGECAVTSSSAALSVNPFPPVAGDYNGLYYESSGVRHGSSGFFTAKVRPSGTFSASLRNGKNKFSFSGAFDVEGNASKVIERRGTNSLMVELSLDLNGEDQITGTVGDGVWTAQLTADRAVFSRANPATNFANSHTMLIPGGTNAAVEPAGDGFGTVQVKADGKLTFKGSLADGSPSVTQSVPLSRRGDWPLYLSLYGGQGSLLGWLGLSPSGETNIAGRLNWFRPPTPKPKVHTNGFNMESMVVGSIFSPIGTNRALNMDMAQAVFSDGNLSQALTNLLAFGPNGRVTNRGPNELTLTVKPATGLFSGKVKPPGAAKAIPFNGVLLQRQEYGGGFFLGTNESGRIRIAE